MNVAKTKTVRRLPRELMPPGDKERLEIIERMKGAWKNRRPDPIRELRAMRKEWDRR